MNIYAIGDLHLSGNPPTKPMNIFGPHWDNHWQRIREHWLSTVTDEDIIFLVGDMSWALRLDEALYDLKEIASLPGQKFMIRGNHDYWWSSANKMKNAMGDAITFLQGHGTARIINLTTQVNALTGESQPSAFCPSVARVATSVLMTLALNRIQINLSMIEKSCVPKRHCRKWSNQSKHYKKNMLKQRIPANHYL